MVSCDCEDAKGFPAEMSLVLFARAGLRRHIAETLPKAEISGAKKCAANASNLLINKWWAQQDSNLRPAD